LKKKKKFLGSKERRGLARVHASILLQHLVTLAGGFLLRRRAEQAPPTYISRGGGTWVRRIVTRQPAEIDDAGLVQGT
jgi:hypothetical protein